MPNIQAIRSLSAPVVVTYESLSITVFPRLQKVNGRESAYSALVREDVDLQIKLEETRQRLQREAVEVGAPVEPSAPAFLQFRTDVEAQLVAARDAMALPDADARESTLSESLVNAVALLGAFDESTQPDAKTVKKREVDAQKKGAQAEAELNALAAQLRGARARRLIFLLTPPEGESDEQVPWDLTEGASETPWPLTEENVLSLSADLVDALLEAVEKKVAGWSVVTVTSMN